MAVDNSVDPGGWLAEQIGACEPDVLRSMVKTMAEALMSAEADAVCGAGYGTRSDERVNRRNGYRVRDWAPAPAPSSRRSRNCVAGPTSPSGCWSGAAGPSRPWSAWSPPPICWGCRRGGWTGWSSRWVATAVLARDLVPDRQIFAVEDDVIGRGPPHLLIGGRHHLPQVLHEPVNQLGEVQRVPRVVVGLGVDRRTVTPDPPVEVQGEREERRGPEVRPVALMSPLRRLQPSGFTQRLHCGCRW